MEDFLSPVGNRHPNSQIADQSKVSPPVDTSEFEEGCEEIPLPSKGVFYHPPYFCAESFHVRPMDFRDEDILTTQRFIEDGTVFDKVVTAVIQNKGVTAQKLVPIDRDTILIWLRANALGKDMTIDYVCVNPLCKEKNVAKWDLSEIKIPEYEPEVLKELQEKGEYRIVTPQKDVIVYIKVPLIEETRDTEKRFLKMKEKDKFDHDSLATAALQNIISGIEVDGKIIRKKTEIMAYFTKIKLPLGDSRYIVKSAEKVNLQYDTRKDLVCTSCGHVQESVSMPIVHQNFLWTQPTP